MKLTILGSNGTYATPGRPASGYLVEHRGTRIWVDAGPGTFAVLQEFTDFVTIDAVVLSHVHADHCTDIMGFYHAVRYGARPRLGVPVFCPDGVGSRLAAFLGEGDQPISATCDFTVVRGDPVEVGGIKMDFALTQHPVPTVAARFEAEGRMLVYSADTGPDGDWSELAKDADLFLVESTYQGASEDKPWPHHLTAGEAGSIGRSAGVGQLVLTHIWPTLDPAVSADEAETSFGREVHLAVPRVAFKV